MDHFMNYCFAKIFFHPSISSGDMKPGYKSPCFSIPYRPYPANTSLLASPKLKLFSQFYLIIEINTVTFLEYLFYLGSCQPDIFILSFHLLSLNFTS